MDEWYHADFSELNVEDMNIFVAKTVKNITLLEKGLPKNLIVPKLKDDVELMKTKVMLVLLGVGFSVSFSCRWWLI